MGLARDAANFCLFAGSGRAGCISGAVIPVDGASSLNAAGTMLDPILQSSFRDCHDVIRRTGSAVLPAIARHSRGNRTHERHYRDSEGDPRQFRAQ
jgi:hypothetical protein